MMQSNDSTVKISVVIPTHNRKHLLFRLLAALQQQTLDDDSYEVIIVHNFTDDGTEEIALNWCAQQPFKARYFKKDYNGPARSRDFGARLALGDYIVFIDDDCIATEYWLESGLLAFERYERQPDGLEVGLIQGRTLPVPDQPRHLLEKTISIQAPTVFYETCNIFYSKKVFIEVGGFSEEFLDKFYGEDTDLGWKVREAGYGIHFSADALVYHEVFHVSVWNWLKEPLYFNNIPYLVKKYPRLRESMYYRWFLTKDTCFFYFFLLGLLSMIMIGPLGMAMATPYFYQRYRSGKHMANPVYRLVRALVGVPRAFFMWWALLIGSIKTRSCLL